MGSFSPGGIFLVLQVLLCHREGCHVRTAVDSAVPGCLPSGAMVVLNSTSQLCRAVACSWVATLNARIPISLMGNSPEVRSTLLHILGYSPGIGRLASRRPILGRERQFGAPLAAPSLAAWASSLCPDSLIFFPMGYCRGPKWAIKNFIFRLSFKVGLFQLNVL